MEKQVYYPYFDYLRLALATTVMLYHDKIFTWEYSGKLAVDIFFALSGWLIGGVLLKTSKQDLPRFFFNRAARIWVPYYIALALLVAASILKDPITGKWLELIFYKLTFVYNLFGTSQLADGAGSFPLDATGNHFWSVNAEEQFYLLAPFLLVLLPSFGRHTLTWLAVVVLAWVFKVYAPICFGVLAAVLAHRYGEFYQQLPYRLLLIGSTLASGCGLMFDVNNYHIYAPIFSISLVLVLAIKGSKHWFGELCGGMSYPLYLNHWIGVFVMNALLDPFDLRDSGYRVLFAAIFGYVFSAGLYWFIERKILSVRSVLFTDRLGLMAAGTAYVMVMVGILGGILFLL